MSIFLYVASVTLVSTLLAVWCGWGLARLTLPAPLKPWSDLLAPCVGYALLLVFGYVIVRNLAGIPVMLLVLLSIAGVVNIFAWRRAPGYASWPPRIPRTGREYLKLLPLLALLFVSLVIGAAPPLSYGYPAVVSANWDFEYYLPKARYLERGPVTAIRDAPANPLRDLNADPAAIGIGHTLGFSIWQGSVDVLTGSEALASLNPVIAWLRVLGLASVYVLFRALFCLRRGPALLGTAFVSMGALLLWTGYFNFGMQMSALPLLPLALILSAASLEDAGARGRRAWPSLLVAAITVAALPVAYQPATALFVPLLAGLLVPLLQRSRHRRRIFASACALGILSLLFAALPLLDYRSGFSSGSLEKLGVILGLTEYIPATDILGFTPFLWQATPSAQVPLEALAALALMSALVVVGLIMSPQRAVMLGLALGAVVYMAWLRFGQQFPYGYMKAAAYVAFPFAGLAAAGAQYLLTLKLPLALRAGAIALPLFLLAMMIPPQSRIIAGSWGKPDLFASDMPSLLELRSQVPAGSRVRITGDTRISGPLTGIVANLLDHASLLGDIGTGYVQSWSSGDADDPGDYTLLLPDEDPAAWGLSSGERVWAGGSFVLYRRAPGVVAHLRLDRTIPTGESFDLSVGAEHLSEGAGQKGGEPRRIVLSLLAFHPAKLLVGAKAFDVQPGASLIDLGEIATPSRLVMANGGPADIIVRSATLLAVNAPLPAGLRLDMQPGQPNTALAQGSAVITGTTATTTVNILVPNIKPVVLALDISDRQGGRRYGWYGIRAVAPGETRIFRLALDLATGTMKGTQAGGTIVPIDAQFTGLQRGDYEARLNLLSGTQLLGAPVAVFSFSVGSGGAVSNIRARLSAPLVMPSAQPALPINVRARDDARLLGYDLSNSTIYPGQELSLTLWWEPLKAELDERSILLHLRDAGGTKYAQADGPPANGEYPTSAWKLGDLVIDRHTLTIPPDLPSGNYTLAVGTYHYPSVEMVPLYRDGVRLDGDVLLIPIMVKRW